MAESGSRTKSFKREADVLLEQFNRQLKEQLMTAEMRIDDTERKLQVLLKRLNRDVNQRGSQVEDSTTHRQSLATQFLEDTTNIDNHPSRRLQLGRIADHHGQPRQDRSCLGRRIRANRWSSAPTSGARQGGRNQS